MSDIKPTLVVAMTPDPFVGGVMKRQWRRLRGMLAGLKPGVWIALDLPESADVSRVRGVIASMRWSSMWTYKDMEFQSRRDADNPKRVLVCKVKD